MACECRQHCVPSSKRETGVELLQVVVVFAVGVLVVFVVAAF